MTKMKMHTLSLTKKLLELIAEKAPNCFTESQNTEGKLTKTIDFDLLHQELSEHIVEGPQERYHLNWPGKRESLLTANAPIAKTLRPCREESVGFDVTENIFIEGDSLDALKLLQETYLGKVKMIYIDPPYNTGKDFIYSDHFAESSEGYLLESGQKDVEGNRLVANTDSNGRFHSDWLSMMYPRLKLAGNLLRDDGAIFISIDDNEAYNLRKLCDEVFGEVNFVGVFTWKTKRGARGVPPVNLLMSNHEYIVCYSKASGIRFKGLERNKDDFDNPDNDPRGLWRSESIRATGSQDNFFKIINPDNNNEHYGNWAFSQEAIKKMISNELILFPPKKGGTPRQKKFMDSYTNERKAIVTSLGWHSTENSTKDLMDLFDGKKMFDFPKPLSLIEFISEQSLSCDDIVLDFFAGSATTAHAIMKLNAEDGGNRKFIMVQLPEICDEKSQAFKAGYSTIAEISKERIRRAGKKIKEENAGQEGTENLDIGFRVLKIDSSNMADVYYTPDTVEQDLLSSQTDNIKDDRSAEDLLFQVLLDWGVDLSLPITKEFITDNEVFFVDKNALAACFVKSGEITEDFVKELAKREPLRVVFRDAGFKDDSVKINVAQIFTLMSPHTEVKTI